MNQWAHIHTHPMMTHTINLSSQISPNSLCNMLCTTLTHSKLLCNNDEWQHPITQLIQFSLNDDEWQHTFIQFHPNLPLSLHSPLTIHSSQHTGQPHKDNHGDDELTWPHSRPFHPDTNCKPNDHSSNDRNAPSTNHPTGYTWPTATVPHWHPQMQTFPRPQIKLCTLNIISGCKGQLEGALCTMDMLNVDIGVLTKTKLDHDKYTPLQFGYTTLATKAISHSQGGLHYPGAVMPLPSTSKTPTKYHLTQLQPPLSPDTTNGC